MITLLFFQQCEVMSNYNFVEDGCN